MFLIFFRGVIGDLGEGFGRCDADRYWYAGPSQYGGAQRQGMAFETRAETRHSEKCFVDRIDLEIGREVAQHLHHPGAHIAVERVVARTHNDAGGREAIAMQMPWRTHGDAERLGFVAARDHAAVIVGQHYDRLAA